MPGLEAPGFKRDYGARGEVDSRNGAKKISLRTGQTPWRLTR
jgi:hypothetical protein